MSSKCSRRQRTRTVPCATALAHCVGLGAELCDHRIEMAVDRVTIGISHSISNGVGPVQYLDFIGG
jgi:hypothetical protein